MKEEKIDIIQFTKYEKARILGARSLQISMNAPPLLDLSQEELKKINYDSFNIANLEFEGGCLPISVVRPMPRKIESNLSIERKRIESEKEKDPQTIIEKEKKVEKEIREGGEIMDLVKSEDEEKEEFSLNEEEGI